MTMAHADKLRFLAAGGANTLATWALYWLLLLALDPRFAYALAYASGIVLSYTLNSMWVFQRRWNAAGLLAFALGYGLQALLAYGLFLALLAFTPLPAWLLPVAITLVLLPLTFLMNRELVQRTSAQAEPPTGAPR